MTSFNPYFHGVVAAIWDSADNALSHAIVSILIFMEWSLQSIDGFALEFVSSSFNPYFHGVVAAIIPYDFWKQRKGVFQSLFSWSGRCNKEGKQLFIFEMNRFQSLFSWSGRCNCPSEYWVILYNWVSILIFMEWSLQLYSYRNTIGWKCVSILIFMEWSLQLRKEYIQKGYTKEFQSLFSWSGRCN